MRTNARPRRASAGRPSPCSPTAARSTRWCASRPCARPRPSPSPAARRPSPTPNSSRARTRWRGRCMPRAWCRAMRWGCAPRAALRRSWACWVSSRAAPPTCPSIPSIRRPAWRWCSRIRAPASSPPSRTSCRASTARRCASSPSARRGPRAPPHPGRPRSIPRASPTSCTPRGPRAGPRESRCRIAPSPACSRRSAACCRSGPATCSLP